MRCPRRAGKSWALGSLVLDLMLRSPGAQCLYITITRGQGKRIFWTWLQRRVADLTLEATWHHTELRMTLANGSSVFLSGAENVADVDKFRGIAYDLVVIDECKSFLPTLFDEMVEEVITPALTDRDGTLIIGGTPGAVLAGRFYEATGSDATMSRVNDDGERYRMSRLYARRAEDEVPFLWSLHTWTLRENVKNRTARGQSMWDRALAMKARNGWADDNPVWRREWLGEWVADTDAFVFHYDPAQHAHEIAASAENWGLPDGHEWHYVLGLDLGFDDDFDIEVAAYADSFPILFHLYGYAETGLSVAGMAREIERVKTMFPEFDSMVGDRGGLGKVVFAELANTYGLQIEPADKHQKRDHIELLDTEIREGRLKILRNSNLANQLSMAQWADAKLRKQIHRDFADHAIDAFLYLFRHAENRRHVDKVKAPVHGSPDWLREAEARAIERINLAHAQRHGRYLDPVDDSPLQDPVSPEEQWVQ